MKITRGRGIWGRKNTITSSKRVFNPRAWHDWQYVVIDTLKLFRKIKWISPFFFMNLFEIFKSVMQSKYIVFAS